VGDRPGFGRSQTSPFVERDGDADPWESRGSASGVRPPREFAPLVQAPAPFKGRYMRPRAIEVAQSPEKILDANPLRIGAYLFNNGSILEFGVELPQNPLAAGLAQAVVLDSAGIQIPVVAASSYKSLIFVVDTALTWVGAGQAKFQLVVGRRDVWAPVSGAASGVGPASGNSNSLKGAQVNLGGAAVTTIATGIYPFSPADIGDLQWHHPIVGAEFTFPGALTAGAGRLFLEMPGGAALFVGEEYAISGVAGPRSNAWSITAQSAPTFIQDDGEVWAIAGPGGVIDLRIWEVWKYDPEEAYG
jgi:hypothetical protein